MRLSRCLVGTWAGTSLLYAPPSRYPSSVECQTLPGNPFGRGSRPRPSVSLWREQQAAWGYPTLGMCVALSRGGGITSSAVASASPARSRDPLAPLSRVYQGPLWPLPCQPCTAALARDVSVNSCGGPLPERPRPPATSAPRGSRSGLILDRMT